jgi:hypothetical protein
MKGPAMISSRRSSAVAAVLALSCSGFALADECTHWNGVLLQAIRTTGGPPCPIGRACAMMHLTVYDAVNSISRTHQPYFAFEEVDAGASKEAAIAAAAHRVLVELYPVQQKMLDAEYADRLALIPDGPAKDAGMALGESCAGVMMSHRVDDGSNNPIEYVFGTNPGDYVTPEDVSPNTPPFNPEWGASLPFAMTSGTQFRPVGPLGHTVMSELLQSAEYATQLNEIKTIGARDSKVRSDEQTRIAFFWANDVNGTYKPPGQLLNMTAQISESLGLTLEENVRLFALVGLAMGDAGVVAWDAKYNTDIDLWRPISGIRRADTDGNPGTEADPEWLPLNSFTPPFPAWISGHSTFGGAWAAVAAAFFRTDNVSFTITSEDPFYAKLPDAGPRSFESFSEAGFEDAISRIYLGVHWRTDCEDGYASGHALGSYIGETFFDALCPADFNADGVPNSQDFFDYLTAFFADNWRAEFNGDGVRNSQDLFDYLTAFFAGC